MILNGNPRGSAEEMAFHLLKDENEIVQIHELRGFVSRDLHGAFNEIYALSRGTKCDEFLYSLSLNPPPYADVPDAEFITAIEEAEKRLNLSGQPRAIVFHEKEGRRHCHVVWSRIDTQTMKARQQSFDKMKLTAYSRELFLEHGWEMPCGLAERGRSDPRNYTHAEHQQAQRVGKHAGQIKEEIQAAWAASDTQAAFEAALAESGYVLARGDKRSFVIIDAHGEIYSLPRVLKLKTKAVRARLGDPEHLPSVDDVLAELAQRREAGKANAPALTPKAPTRAEAFEELTRYHAAFTKQTADKALKALIPNALARDAMVEDIFKHSDIVKIGAHNGRDVFAAREMIALETRMIGNAKEMATRRSHKSDPHAITRAVFALNNRLAAETGGAARLSDEQIAALQSMAGDKQLSLIVGVAGAGKTTIMAGAKDALESQGYRVRGAAPSGIAAAALKDAGMQASTLHALEVRIENARDILDNNQGKPLTQKQQDFVKSALLTDKDVLIVDEAGMVDSPRLARVIEMCSQSGAKLVLVGDPQQLQSVEAGAAFRNLVEREESVALTEVRRQKTDRQREATRMFSRGETAEALSIYDKSGDIIRAKTRGDARDALVADYMAAFDKNPDSSRLALAYTRKDVAALNEAIRAELVTRGAVAQDSVTLTISIKEKNAVREEQQDFAAGDRICFRENNTELGVMNGSFGTLEAVSENALTVKLDNGQRVMFSPKDYTHFTHGYAATVHKSQGMTVDECYVLASKLFDRHTSYVAMSRHKYAVKLYAAKRDFKNKVALYNALGRKSDKVSTLDFTDSQKSRKAVKLPWHKRLVTACKSTIMRIRGMEPKTAQKPQRRTEPLPQNRDANIYRAERDAALHALKQTPQPPKQQDMAALRDHFLQSAAEHRRHDEKLRTSEPRRPSGPTLER